MTDLDEGTKAIIKLITREAIDIHEDKFNEITERNNKYLDGKFLCLENKIGEVKKIVDSIDKNGCKLCLDHIEEQKDKEKKTIKLVTLISVSIPTIIILGNWIKGMIIGWIQRPPMTPHN